MQHVQLHTPSQLEFVKSLLFPLAIPCHLPHSHLFLGLLLYLAIVVEWI